MREINFFKERALLRLPSIIIMYLFERKDHIANVGRQCKVSYAHASKIIIFLVDNDYIKRSKEGKKVYIELTEKGERLARELIAIRNNLR